MNYGKALRKGYEKSLRRKKISVFPEWWNAFLKGLALGSGTLQPGKAEGCGAPKY